MNKKIERWKKILFINRVLLPDAFFVVVEVQFFISYLGISFENYSILMGISYCMSIFLEVPCGFLSDIFSRKKMLIAGTMLGIFSDFLLIILGKYSLVGVYALKIASVVGGAFAGGNFSALIYENAYNQNAKQEQVQRFSVKSYSTGALFSSTTGIAASWMFSKFMQLPLIADMLVYVTKIGSYFFLKDSDKQTSLNKNKKNSNNFLSFFKIKTNTRFLIIFFTVLFLFSRMSFSLLQPIMNEEKISIVFYGGFVSGLNLFVFLISNIIVKQLERKGIRIIFSFSITIMILQFILLIVFVKQGIFGLVIIMVAFLATQFVRVFSEGLDSYYISNTILKEKNKTTIFAVYRVFIIGGMSLSFFFISILHNFAKSFIGTYLIFTLILIFCICILGFYSAIKKTFSSIDNAYLPMKVTLYITGKCLYSCNYCFWKEKSFLTKEDMTIKNFKKIVKYLKQHNVSIVSLAGGDPLLHPKIILFLEILQKNKLYPVIATNLSNENPNFYKELSQNGVKYLQIGLDSISDKKILNYKKNGYTSDILDKLSILQENNILYGMGICVNAKNYLEIKNLIKFAKINNFESAKISFYSGNNDMYKMNKMQIDSVLNFCKSYNEKHPNFIRIPEKGFGIKVQTKMPALDIYPNGEMFLGSNMKNIGNAFLNDFGINYSREVEKENVEK